MNDGERIVRAIQNRVIDCIAGVMFTLIFYFPVMALKELFSDKAKSWLDILLYVVVFLVAGILVRPVWDRK
ncbi:MAG TPA: hypothetical protein PLE04_12775 [Syntrophales bacterium]|nr:hypothetical protein [Syntrophales bacterium]